MVTGSVFIVGREDPPPWTDIADKLTAAPLSGQTRWAIIQGGMVSGATSITVAFPLADGQWVTFQTSLAILKSVLAAARGAEARWADEARKGNGQ